MLVPTTTKKWEETGLLQNLSESKKDEVACLLEEQAQWLFNEEPGECKAELFEFSLPLIRRIFGNVDFERTDDICVAIPLGKILRYNSNETRYDNIDQAVEWCEQVANKVIKTYPRLKVGQGPIMFVSVGDDELWLNAQPL